MKQMEGSLHFQLLLPGYRVTANGGPVIDAATPLQYPVSIHHLKS